MRTRIDLHEHPGVRIALPSAAVRGRTPFARTADPCFPEDPSHARPGEGDSFPLAQLLGQMHLIEPNILRRRQSLYLLPHCCGQCVRGLTPPIAMRESRHAVPTEGRQ